MKKNLFFALAAVATLASCSQEMGFLPAADQTGNEITFSAYAETAVTRGTVKELTDFYLNASGDGGIGVFAFYQPANGSTKQNYNSFTFATPDFMYNQQVKAASADAVWTYSPVKYWPNNANDQLSFFAYAPYEADKTWEAMNIKTDVKGSKMVINFPIYADVISQEDYLYAAPVLNKSKQKTINSENSYSYNSTDDDNSIKFEFKHITAQVNLYAGVEQNTASAAPTAWTDGDTKIEIKSIVFTGIKDGISYTYNPSNYDKTNAAVSSEDTINVELTKENFTDSCVIYTDTYVKAGFKKLNKDNSVMFLAPQFLSTVKVTYTVTTTASNDAMNSSVVTNCIENSLKTLELEAGKSYRLNFLIGMNSVKIVSTLVDWADATNWNGGNTKQEDVPANN